MAHVFTINEAQEKLGNSDMVNIGDTIIMSRPGHILNPHNNNL
jgi:hypothetical protein